ncbi:amidohydrolase family protein [Amaricoccus tamworthensis]|uniref:amidohydrolase family protein n=1 Tax=Amaricoccus tamworthensis TaxID=57002 RepID=UPI003C7E05A0
MVEWLDGIDLVDGHHHFWDLSRFPYRWLAPDAPPARFGDKASISRDFLPADYLATFRDLPLAASVHVQANCGAADPVEETLWLQELAERDGWPSAIVAEVDLCCTDARAQIARHLRVPALRGVRTPVAWDAEGRWRVADRPEVLSDPGFRSVLKTLEDNQLCLEFVVVPEQLSEVRALAIDHPALKLVINHFATLEPGRPGNARNWLDGIKALADVENVYVKLSGLWTVDRKWRSSVIAPYIAHLLNFIGPDRVLYGSNLPVETVNCPVGEQFKQLTSVFSGQTRAVVRSVFSDTARRLYRIQ